MKRSAKYIGMGAAIVGAVALGAFGHAFIMGHGGHGEQGDAGSAGHAEHMNAPAAAAPPTSQGRILYWYDPMVPQQRFDKPGKSPFMDMDLVPKYADEADADVNANSAAGGVRIDPRMAQNLGLRLAAVERGSLEGGIEAVGSVAFDENRIQVVQSRVGGYVEEQSVRALNQPVAKGARLLSITSPELIAGQQELLLAQKANDALLTDAVVERLTLAGMSPRQIEAVRRSGKVTQRVAITAPEAGIVTELTARPGMTVAAGAALLRISGLGSVWLVADVPERDAAALAAGRRAEARFAALPGRSFEGGVDYVYPEIAGGSRSLRVRIPLANPRGELRPGMLANVRFGGSARESLLVPGEAVIETGRRSVVIVADGKGGFRPVEVKTGASDGARTEILSGVEAGTKVVVSGQFLIDSEASLRGTLARLESQPPRDGTAGHAPGAATLAAAPQPAGHGDHAHSAGQAGAAAPRLAQGTVEEVDAAKGYIRLTHGPIPSLSMSGMTMGFKADAALLRGIAPGQAVWFDAEKRGTDYVVTVLKPRTAEGKP